MYIIINFNKNIYYLLILIINIIASVIKELQIKNFDFKFLRYFNQFFCFCYKISFFLNQIFLLINHFPRNSNWNTQQHYYLKYYFD